MSDSVTPWTVAHQAPLSMGFSRQEYWSGLPWGSAPTQGWNPTLMSAALAGVLPGEHQVISHLIDTFHEASFLYLLTDAFHSLWCHAPCLYDPAPLKALL